MYVRLLLITSVISSILSITLVFGYTKTGYTDTGTGQKIVFCQYDVTAVGRPDLFSCPPEQIDISKCDYIVAIYALLDENQQIMVPPSPQAEDIFRRLTKLKIPVLISWGGWVDSGQKNKQYRNLLKTNEKRNKFVQEAVKFVEKYGFKGLEMSYMYPGCPQMHCKRKHRDERDLYRDLGRQLSQAFRPKKLLLTMVVPWDHGKRRASIRMEQWVDFIDFVVVWTIDFHGWWLERAYPANHFWDIGGTDARKDHKGIMLTINRIMDKEKDFPFDRLVFIVAFYGRSYRLKKTDAYWHEKIKGPGKGGLVTKEDGLLIYTELCQSAYTDVIIGEMTTTYFDIGDMAQMGRFSYQMNLGGVEVHTLNMDDCTGDLCKCGQKFPLLDALSDTVKGKPRRPAENIDCIYPGSVRKLF